MLEIHGLVKRYPTGDRALRGVDLTVPEGQVMALIGPSGAGKSTLIRCVNRLVEPTEGRIDLDGEDLTRLGPRALRRARRQIGMIFQGFALVERLSVMENVLSGRLGYVGFWRSTLRRFPQTDVDQAFGLLERVGLAGIARALMQAPKLLLVDEPTASLDPKTSRQIMRLITELALERRVAAIINIHDVALAKRFVPRIVGLREGEVVFDGAPAALDAARLTDIYGDEDWDERPEADADEADAVEPTEAVA